ncbi:MAG TPA: hypothetical protein VNY52_06605 [Solirubrobacteraceae bacterium]|jgi:hypothetical protein|nr:hypothetical protein [Solirubrobacteraceae bacterium]
MRYHHQKGTTVTDPERSPKTPSIATWIFAGLRAFLHVKGSGAPPVPRGRGLALPAILLVLATALTFLAASAALATNETGPPKFDFPLKAKEIHATRATLEAASEDPIASGEIHWKIEYATSPSGPWAVAGEAVITGSHPEDEPPVFAGAALVEVGHLAPETHYYARILAENKSGSASSSTEFTTTGPSAPEIGSKAPQGQSPCPGAESDFGGGICGPVTPPPTSAEFNTRVETNALETTYGCEYSTSESGPWTPVAGGSGTITVAEDSTELDLHLTGLSPETRYYLLCEASNEKGAAKALASFQTHTDHPQASVGLSNNVTGTSVHLPLGGVRPNGYETHWRYEYAPAEANGQAPVESSAAWRPAPEAQGTIPQAEAGYTEQGKTVEGDITGLTPSTVYYIRLFAESTKGTVTTNPERFETAGAPLAVTFATHAIHGEAMRILGSVEPHGYDTHYRFQYVIQEQFEKPGPEGEWAAAKETPEVDLGAGVKEGENIFHDFRGYGTQLVGQDLPGLQPGVTYRYRIVAASTAPGNPVIDGEGATLTVPAPSDAGAGESCPNESLRIGLSAHLRDCRAYEQVTPVDKEGTFDILKYGAVAGGGGLVGEDGNHLVFNASFTKWGQSQSPYLFSRDPEKGWQMTAGAPQPEAGIDAYAPELFSPDLTDLAVRAQWQTSGVAMSPEVEFKAGPAGGPYVSIKVPRAQAQASEDGWVGASEDFSRLVLAVEDRELVKGHPTGTASGADLYEYSTQPGLRQLNVDSAGATIGGCGAAIAKGRAEESPAGAGGSSPHALSPDGSRIFFQAAPGSDCSEPTHLYMRVNGTETVDIGPYTFVAANREDTELLLDQRHGGNVEYFLYDTATATAKPIFTIPGGSQLLVSEDFNAIYFGSTTRLTADAPPTPDAFTEELYRYEIPTETLRFVVQVEVGALNGGRSVSPDGRYYYFGAQLVVAVPGAGKAPETPAAEHANPQVYRYDSVEDVLECVSCASSFDPEPRLGATLAAADGFRGVAEPRNGTPREISASANGDFVFFATAAALLPADVDGEVAPELGNAGGEHASNDGFTSLSSDVYEWRRLGVDGCALPQGCLSLITPGTGGYQVTLIGATESGGDVFFTTHSELLPRDNDTADDIYDARVGGGFPEPTRAVECEGDSCSTPFAAPSDLTPSSATFQGAGDVLGASPPEAMAKPTEKQTKKKARKKTNSRRGGKSRKGGKSSRKAKQSNRRAR